MPHKTSNVSPPERSVATLAARAASTESAIFRQEGDFWTLSDAQKTIRIRDIKGLAYIAHLLSQPNTEIHTIELAQVGVSAAELEGGTANSRPNFAEREAAGLHVGRLGDAGELLDDQAKAAYRRRLAELQDVQAEARASGQVDRAEAAELEIDALMTELSRATGLRGRNRVAASSSERARQSVTRAIKAALTRITDHHPSMGQMLARCIKTGTYCVYIPDPNSSLAWELTSQLTTDSSSREDHASPDAPVNTSPAEERQLFAGTPSSTGHTEFVGREREVKLLRKVVDRAASGITALAMLSGGPGMGKTRLVNEVARYAHEKGFGYFSGRCHESGDPFPYLPFAEALESMLERSLSREQYKEAAAPVAGELAQIAPSLRRIFPDLPLRPEVPEGQLSHFILRGFAEFLSRASRRAPLLIFLDDLHWADDATLRLLSFLTCSTVQMPLVIMGTYRDTEPASSSGLLRVLDELIRGGTRPLKLRGLSHNEVAQMIRSLSTREPPLALVNLAYDETQGNPFFVEEVFKHLVEEGKLFDAHGEFRSGLALDENDIPEHVRLVLKRRLQRLTESARQILTTAAIIGRSFSFQLLQNVEGSIAIDDLLEAIEQAHQMGFVVNSEGSESNLSFAHELVRHTLLGDISKPRYQRLHLVVADSIERRATEDPGGSRAMEIADHLRKAGPLADASKVARYLAEAGKHALASGGYEEARRNFEDAISYRTGDGRWRAQCLEFNEKALRGLNRPEEAISAILEAIDIYRELGELKLAAGALARVSLTSLSIGRSQDATELALRGLTLVGDEPSDSRADLLASLGQSYLLSGIYVSAKEALTEAIAVSRQLSNSELSARVFAQLAAVNETFLEMHESMANSQASLDLHPTDLFAIARTTALFGQVMALHRLGRIAESAQRAAELEPLARKAGYVYFEAVCGWMNAWASFGIAPDVSTLEERFEKHVEIARASRIPLVIGLALAQLILAKFYRGERADALSIAHEANQTAIPPSTRGFATGILFRELAYAGDRDGAMALLDREQGGLPAVDQPSVLGSWAFLVSAIEGLAVLGERIRTAELFPLAERLLETGVVTFPMASRFSRTAAGIASTAAHQWQSAEEHFRVALRQAHEIPDHFERADIQRFYGSMLLERDSRGDHEQARRLLSDALAGYTRFAMPTFIELTEAKLSHI